jgi:20S proteasome alpha/beta subunit
MVHSLRRPQHAEKSTIRRFFGRDLVTVCIAAIASDGHIVTASDTLISWGNFVSSDATSVKVEPFHGSWLAMMSGDMSQCLPIVERATEKLEGKPSTLSIIKRGFREAYKEHLAETAADQVLSNYNMEMKEFKKNGAKIFTPEVFNSLNQEIKAVSLDCSFLVYGFDERGFPHILSVEPPGKVASFDKPGFWAIGSGSFAATGMLFSLHQSVDCSLNETIFDVLAAKFMAETPGVVGEHTHFYVHEKNCDWFSYPAGLVPAMRNWWNDKGKPRRDNTVLQQFRREDFSFRSFRAALEK